jgi:Uma2 family endonuclease
MFLSTLLNLYVTDKALGEMYAAGLQMKLAVPPRGREPDLLFVAKEHLDRFQGIYLNGPADLAVEIVSPESTRRDRGEKYSEYEMAGVPEYWLIDPRREQVDFYRLIDERYQLILGGRTGRYTSAIIPGFWLEAEWLWQEPLPPVTEIWRQISES